MIKENLWKRCYADGVEKLRHLFIEDMNPEVQNMFLSGLCFWVHVVLSERTIMIKLIRIKELSTIISSSRSKIYADIQNGTFMPPVPLGSRAVAFPENEIAEWVKARIAGASSDELKALVVKYQ